MGLRAQESQTRASDPVFSLRTDTSALTKGRFVYDWLPIHDWTETDVWDCIRRHGNIHHEAYSLGNHRLSCALCVLASLNDLINGAAPTILPPTVNTAGSKLYHMAFVRLLAE
ncbi:MAG: phosphoadenosine phosphosulfate reductase family protein [Anaerolineae bacterium]